MQVCGSVGGYVGACSAADGGAASPGPGRAGFPKISQILFLILFFDPVARSWAEAVLLSKSMHCIDLLRRTASAQDLLRILGGDLHENGCFIEVNCVLR